MSASKASPTQTASAAEDVKVKEKIVRSPSIDAVREYWTTQEGRNGPLVLMADLRNKLWLVERPTAQQIKKHVASAKAGNGGHGGFIVTPPKGGLKMVKDETMLLTFWCAMNIQIAAIPGLDAQLRKRNLPGSITIAPNPVHKCMELRLATHDESKEMKEKSEQHRKQMKQKEEDELLKAVANLKIVEEKRPSPSNPPKPDVYIMRLQIFEASPTKKLLVSEYVTLPHAAIELYGVKEVVESERAAWLAKHKSKKTFPTEDVTLEHQVVRHFG